VRLSTRIIEVEELRRLTGQEIGASEWMRIEQPMIDAFAGATGDRQWIHVDTGRAQRESRYGRTIAHGFLTLSLLSRLSNEAVEVRGAFGMRINYGLNRVRFPAPVPEGSRIRARLALGELQDIPGGHQIVWLATVDVEGSEKPALVAEWVIRLYF
jgi:acyl dehydratase